MVDKVITSTRDGQACLSQSKDSVLECNVGDSESVQYKEYLGEDLKYNLQSVLNRESGPKRHLHVAIVHSHLSPVRQITGYCTLH